MNIKILDSWLREYLKTDAKPKQLAEALSLTSVSIERIEDYGKDKLYDIEVTTNRPDLVSVVGLAREASAVLPQFGIDAEFIKPKLTKPKKQERQEEAIRIVNDPTLVNRICAVVMDVRVLESPSYIKDRLEKAGIRSLNNVIDVTNYVMRTIGHPTHVFDFDRLNTKVLTIRESKKGEQVITLDMKEHTLLGGDIVAVDENNRIVDLLGIMGLENSVVTDTTKRILFLIDNNDKWRMRKTSMGLAIRTEAAQLNEKGIDPELAFDALLFGIRMFEEIADGEVVSDIIDIYPNKITSPKIPVSEEKIKTVIGVPIPLKKSAEILTRLGFTVTIQKNVLEVLVPSARVSDISLEEDVIEEIARVYGYHNLPSILPSLTSSQSTSLGTNPFFWEKRIKDAMKYWGFTEVYTYSMVSEDMYEGPIVEAVTLKNPLGEEYMYMRSSLVPSLLKAVEENRNRETIKIFEIANVYREKKEDLPLETQMFAGIIKHPEVSFYEAKGLVEQLFTDIGIQQFEFKPTKRGGLGADVFVGRENIGKIEILDRSLIDFEMNFETIREHASLKKVYTPLAKYPPVIEDIALVVPEDVLTGDIIDTIKKQSSLIKNVTLFDRYETTRTFHIIYQAPDRNLTSEEVSEVRESIVKSLKNKFKIEMK